MATPNERLIYGAKTDSIELMQQVLEGEEPFDINHQDGLGNTALHYAASTPSPDALSLLLDNDSTDVDLQNRLDRATPLLLAVKLENEAARVGVIGMLLDAGADPSIKDRHSLRLQDYLRPSSSETDKEILQMIRVAMNERTMGTTASSAAGNPDLANDDDDDEGEQGGSGSESD
ncbi:hypothetical protein JCM10908_005673 [Rhodotorula pacifica]|uniref:ankyrin repeat domain-containing protein n=1 Tax=Rhodotorula pacifica TaxID=1495444 RepID=UPI00316BBDEE